MAHLTFCCADVCPRFVRLAHGSLRCWPVKQHLRGAASGSAPPHRWGTAVVGGWGGWENLGIHFVLEKFPKNPNFSKSGLVEFSGQESY